jgi:hypothetical protein
MPLITNGFLAGRRRWKKWGTFVAGLCFEQPRRLAIELGTVGFSGVDRGLLRRRPPERRC